MTLGARQQRGHVLAIKKSQIKQKQLLSFLVLEATRCYALVIIITFKHLLLIIKPSRVVNSCFEDNSSNYTFTPLPVFIVLSIGVPPWKTQLDPLGK
jgi:hypothetical protein